MNAPAEEWRVIADFPHYAVSSLGRVKRIATDARGHALTGKCLVPAASPWREYLHVTLCRDGTTKCVRLNRLVCEAFHGSPPSPRHHAAHNDGDTTNNRATNLRWATGRENEADKRQHGTAAIGDKHWSKLKPECRARGERHGLSKLNADLVRAIRADGREQREIARSFGIHQATVHNIKAGKTWSHVQ